MSQFLASRWEPSVILNIITPDNDISCVGTTLKGLPCGWRLDGAIKAQIRTLLRQMSEKSPRRALNDLPELTELCLCEKNHRYQAERVLNKWTPLVQNYASLMENREPRQPQELYSSPNSEINRFSTRNVRTPELRTADYILEDLIVRIETLDITQMERLQRVLQQKLPKAGYPSPNSSPIQSLPSSVATPRYESPPGFVATPRYESPPSSQQNSGSGRNKGGFWRRRRS